VEPSTNYNSRMIEGNENTLNKQSRNVVMNTVMGNELLKKQLM